MLQMWSVKLGTLQIFASTPPWGILTEKRIFQLVVQEDTRPDRPDLEVCSKVGLSDQIWSVIEESWHKESRLRPTFEHIAKLWHTSEDRAQRPVSRPGSLISRWPLDTLTVSL